MKRTNVLWLSLLAMALYVALSHTPAEAQQQSQQSTTVRMNKVHHNETRDGGTIQVNGRIVGFACYTNVVGGGDCFVATID